MWLVLVALALLPLVTALQNITVQAQDTHDISYSGNWTNNNDYCTSTRFASNQGDELTFTFQGVAIYAIGTVDCGWSGLLSISLDGQNTEFNRRNCSLLPPGGPTYICEYPWIARTGLDPSTSHTLTITLMGPPIAQASLGHLIADLRYLIYTIDPSATSSPMVTSTKGAVTSSTQHSSHTGAIVGGVIGGLLGLSLAALVVVLGCRRRRAQNAATTTMTHGDYLPPATWAPAPTPFVQYPTGPEDAPSQDKAPSFPQPRPYDQFYATLPMTDAPRSHITPSAYDRPLSSDYNPYAAGSSSPLSSTGRPLSQSTGSSSVPDPELVSRVTSAVLAAMREGEAVPPPAYDETRRT